MRRNLFFALMPLLLTIPLLPSSAQDISQIAKSDPLIITGAVGTRNTYYHSTGSMGYASPLSNTIYANLNVSVYGFSMPFSFYYSNDNLDFNYPHLSFNVSPRYKNWQLYFGQSTMPFSSYVMTMPFNGVGLEYQGDRLRAGMFYGRLRKAVNDDPTDPLARTPQYKRMAWGFKVGYGSTRNYIDLYLLRAYDQQKSLDPGWHEVLQPQDNLVVGLRGAVSVKRFLSFTANASTSVFTVDKTSSRVEDSRLERFDKVFTARNTSMARFAGDISANLSLKGFNAQLFYRMIQPDYTSLGTYYLSNNYHSLGINLGTILFRRLSLSASFSGQEDNLTNKQLYTTRGLVYNANASTRIGKHIGINAGYNGYRQTQADGTARVNDTTRVNRIMHSVYFMPSYSTYTDKLTHTVSLSTNMTRNEDLNRFATGESDVTTYAAGLSYNIGVVPWDMDFTTSFSHQRSDGYQSRYTSDIASLTTSRAFLNEKNLTAALTLSLCYNEIRYKMKSLSLGGDISVGYTLNKVHVFGLMAGISKYGDVNITRRESGLDDTEISVGLNYTYTFSLFALKRQAEQGKKGLDVQWGKRARR